MEELLSVIPYYSPYSAASMIHSFIFVSQFLPVVVVVIYLIIIYQLICRKYNENKEL